MKQKYRIRPGNYFRFRIQTETSFLGLFKFWRTVHMTDYAENARHVIEVCQGELVP